MYIYIYTYIYIYCTILDYTIPYYTVLITGALLRSS